MTRKQYHPRDEIPPERLRAVERLESGQPLSDEDLYQLKIYIIRLEEDSGMAMRYLDQDIAINQQLLESMEALSALLRDAE